MIEGNEHQSFQHKNINSEGWSFRFRALVQSDVATKCMNDNLGEAIFIFNDVTLVEVYLQGCATYG